MSEKKLNENCKHLGVGGKSCLILKEPYCQLEPGKKCAWYKSKEAEENKDDKD